MMGLFLIGQFILSIGIAYWLIHLTNLLAQ